MYGWLQSRATSQACQWADGIARGHGRFDACVRCRRRANYIRDQMCWNEVELTSWVLVAKWFNFS